MIESQKSNFERSVLVGIINDSQNEEKLNEFLEELEFLSLTAGGTVVKKFTQKINTPNSKTFIGKGKIEEIQKYVKKNDVYSSRAIPARSLPSIGGSKLGIAPLIKSGFFCQ